MYRAIRSFSADGLHDGVTTIGAGPPPRPPAVVPGFVAYGTTFDASDPVVAAVRAGRTRPSVQRPEDLLQEVPDGG